MQVTFYNSLDEMMEAIESARQAADARAKPWQAAVKVGDCFVVLYEGLTIYGVVLAQYEEKYLQHFRYTRCFSQAVPTGEYGDTHVSTIAAIIPPAIFAAAEQQGWPDLIVGSIVELEAVGTHKCTVTIAYPNVEGTSHTTVDRTWLQHMLTSANLTRLGDLVGKQVIFPPHAPSQLYLYKE